MRIGLVSWDYAPPKGGLGRAMQSLKGALQELGHEVHVCVPKTLTGGPFLYSLILFFTLPHWVRSKKIDTLVFPVGPGGIFLVQKIRSVRTIAISYHTYGQQARDVPGESWKRVFIPFEKAALHTADRILCYSRDTQKFLHRSYGFSSDAIRYCTQLLPRELFEHAPVRKQQGLCVAVLRLDRRKGLDVLLRAWPLVQAEHTSARLVIVGDGMMKASVDRFVSLYPQVSRVSRLSDRELRTLISGAEIAFCPAYLEGFGLAAAEAMLLGTVLVAADSDGLRSLVKHGILFPPGGASALAHATSRLLADAALRTQLPRAAADGLRSRFSRGNAKRDRGSALA